MQKAGITKTRQSLTNSGKEVTTYKCAKTLSTTVRVLTNPWLIYTKGETNPKIYVDSYDDYGLPEQYYNYKKIRCAPLGNWGGHGKRKSDGDIVGDFIILDEDMNATAKRKLKGRDLNGGSGRMDW